MEHVRIIEMEENVSILALYNPDDMAENGLKTSTLKNPGSLGIAGPDLIQMIADLVYTNIKIYTQEEYNGYLPVSMSIMNLPGDRVLPAMLLIKQQTASFTQYVTAHIKGQNPLPLDTAAKEHIQDYINEFLHEKDSSQTEQTGDIEQYLFRFDSLTDALSACRLIPFGKCTESCIIKHNNKYYMLLSYKFEKPDDTDIPLLRFLEFGYEEDNITPGFLKEHGTLISDQLENIVKTGL